MGQTNSPLLQVFVWQTDNGSIHLSSDDRRLVDENGNYKGLNIAISKQRQPKTYERLRAFLATEEVKKRKEVSASAQTRREHKTRKPQTQSGASNASKNSVGTESKEAE